MPTHWSVMDNAPACNRSQTHWRTVTCPAEEYFSAKQSDPEKYCSRCAKLCKLSMQGSRSESVRVSTDRSACYAELRKLVEAWQSHQAGSSTALAEWRHR